MSTAKPNPINVEVVSLISDDSEDDVQVSVKETDSTAGATRNSPLPNSSDGKVYQQSTKLRPIENGNNSILHCRAEKNYDKMEPNIQPRKRKPSSSEDLDNLHISELEAAAFQSRLPFEKMTLGETTCFRDVAKKEYSLQQTFLDIRNRILALWFKNPKVQLTVEDVVTRIGSPLNANIKFIQRIHLFLERHGLINFGVFKRLKPIPAKKFAKVIVIGAGMSGLAVAQQLQQFGMDVIVLEARNRVGGRIATFRKNNFHADLGPMIINGIHGNPLKVLTEQTGIKMVPIKQLCPLYGIGGKTVPKDKDEMIEREFKRLLDAISYLSYQLELNTSNCREISLGQAIEWIIKLQEKHVKENQAKHLNKIVSIQEKIIQNEEKIFSLRQKINENKFSLKSLQKNRQKNSNENDIKNIEHDFQIRLLQREWNRMWMDIIELKEENKEFEAKITRLEENPPSEVYLSLNDRQLLDWHLANLEFSNATQLNNLSLKNWDEEEDYQFIGNHWTIKNGFSSLPVAFTEGLDIRLNTSVKTIKYLPNGVEITAQSRITNHSSMTYKADICVCTLPLGVLKSAIDEELVNTTNTVRFEPQLPRWKRAAIERLGVGNVNQVVLCFERIFWNSKTDMFGNVGTTTESRGEIFLFWSLTQTPILVAILGGQAANIIESVPDDIVVGRCIAVLKGIFGNNSVPQPKETFVTRWNSDPFACGSRSYVPVGSSGKDYDLLAAPVCYPVPKETSKEKSKSVPRIFFAGEHTIRKYAATVHGAFLSGLREARRIADFYIGSSSGSEPTKEAGARDD